jgi:DNA polymerase-1
MDGSAFIFRSFYAFRNMSRSDGFPTNVLYMMARLILRLLREERPDFFCIIMDGKGPTFREERFPAYKANRSATPEDLVVQLAPLRQLLDLFGAPVIVSNNCEADDCIASLARWRRDFQPVIILGADKDLKQCLHENVVIWNPAAKDDRLVTLADFRAETGMAPGSWPDCQALMGDASDNIPGVPKIGPKTALELMRTHATLETLFDNLPAVPPNIRSKLQGQRETALLYRDLTRLREDACPELAPDSLRLRPLDLPAALRVMNDYELRAVSRELESMSRAGLLRIGGRSPGCVPPPDPSARRQPDAARNPMPESVGARAAPDARRPRAASAASGRSGSGAGQASLFASPAPAVASFPTACSPGELLPRFSPAQETAVPDALALLSLDEGMLLATHERETVYVGSMDALASLLARFSDPAQARPCLLITADLKTLYKDHACLRALPPSRFFDLSLAAYLLDPEDRAYSWEHLAARWGERAGSAHDPGEHPGFLSLALWRLMAAQLGGAGLEAVFSELELPLAPVLASMEERGLCIDTAAFSAFLAETHDELDRLTAHIHALAGRVFNIRSSQQLSDVLFSVLDLPKAGKTRGGAMSTAQENLEKLTGKHPVVDAILEYRKQEKLRSTYLEPLPRLADAAGRIHTTFNQTATATGRLSSSNPNLQNIPIRGAAGRRLRACFTAAPGMSLVSADYSQIELRVLAHLSGDPTLTDAFLHNEDIHSRTACLLFDTPLARVTPDQRRSAKTINFGLIYGMGAQKLAQELRSSLKEAKEFIERYFARFSRLKDFYDAIEDEARRHGFVVTMTGRRRLTPDILSENTQLRAQARRQAVNTRIQGSAADIIKLAMIAVENDSELHALGARLLLQIHDELLLEAPRDKAGAAGARLALLMSGVSPGAVPLRVPLLVDWGEGHSWAEAH